MNVALKTLNMILFLKIDTRTYDAYVIYQMESLDKATEDRLTQFITQSLPSVLEYKCGYRLFIHGRDDIPGEGQHLIDLVIIVNLCLASVFYNTWCVLKFRIRFFLFCFSCTVRSLFLHRSICHLMSFSPEDLKISNIYLIK